MKLFRKIFWMGLGAGIALWSISKAKAYVRANTPQKAREFVFGSDEENDHIARTTLTDLVDEVKTRQKAREEELTQRFVQRSKPTD